MAIIIALTVLIALTIAAFALARRAVTSARPKDTPNAIPRADAIRNAPTHVLQSRVDQLRARGRKGK